MGLSKIGKTTLSGDDTGLLRMPKTSDLTPEIIEGALPASLSAADASNEENE